MRGWTWAYLRNNAICRCNGIAAHHLEEPKLCQCDAFLWPHLEGISSRCGLLGYATRVLSNYKRRRK